MVSATAAVGGYILAGMALLLAYVLWKKSGQLQEILAEAVTRSENFQGQFIEMRTRLAAADEALDKRSKSTGRLERNLEDWKAKSALLEDRLNEERQIGEQAADRERRHVEKYQGEVAALTEQIRESDQERKELRQALESRKSLASEQYEKDLNQLRQQVADLTTKFTNANQEAKKLAATLEKIDLKDVARIRRKNRQYSQLFMILKGQKEMAEEHARNWEYALRQTASWIVSNRAPKMALPEKIAPLVCTALDLIGGHLFDDSAPDLQEAQNSHPETEQELAALIDQAGSAVSQPYRPSGSSDHSLGQTDVDSSPTGLV